MIESRANTLRGTALHPLYGCSVCTLAGVVSVSVILVHSEMVPRQDFSYEHRTGAVPSWQNGLVMSVL